MQDAAATEEIEALQAIYPEVVAGALPDGSRVLRVPSSPPVVISISRDYPERSPPVVSPARSSALQQWSAGRPILFEIVQELLSSSAEPASAPSPRIDAAPADAHVDFVSSDVVEALRSQFQGHAAFVTSPEEARRVVAAIAESSTKLARATHLCFAYRIPRDAGPAQCDHDDDGEAGAGARLAQVLQGHAAAAQRGAVVVVARWFGCALGACGGLGLTPPRGTNLGPLRFKLIMGAARSALDRLVD